MLSADDDADPTGPQSGDSTPSSPGSRRPTAAAAVVIATAIVAVVVMTGDAFGRSPDSGGQRTRAEAPLAPDEISSPVVIDLSALAVDDDAMGADSASSLVTEHLVIDETRLPDGWTVADVGPHYTTRLIGGSSGPRRYKQSLTLINDDGTTAQVSLRGVASLAPRGLAETRPLSAADFGSRILSEAESVSIRSQTGQVLGSLVEWVESERVLVRVGHDNDPEKALELSRALRFTTVNELDTFVVPRRAWESALSPLIEGPLDSGATWTLDKAEVLVVNGEPIGSGRDPKQLVFSTTSLLVADGFDIIVFGVTTSDITAIKLTADADLLAEIPLVVSPANTGNRLFGFAIPPGARATAFDLVGTEGLVLESIPLPEIALPVQLVSMGLPCEASECGL